MVPTNGVASRKSRTSTPPPQKGASGNKKLNQNLEPLKKPDVKSVDVKGLASSSTTSPPPQKSRSFKCSRCMFVLGLLVSVASLATFLIVMKPVLVTAWFDQVYGSLSKVPIGRLSEISSKVMGFASEVSTKVVNFASPICTKVTAFAVVGWNRAAQILSEYGISGIDLRQLFESTLMKFNRNTTAHYEV
jgi:hypothetical protein